MGADLYIRHPKIRQQVEVAKKLLDRKKDELYCMQKPGSLCDALREIVLHSTPHNQEEGEKAKAILAGADGSKIRALILEIETIADNDPGYFRDSYNKTNLLWRLGMSWWGLCNEEPSLINHKGQITLARAREMLRDVKNRNLDLLSNCRPAPRIEDIKSKVTGKGARAMMHRWETEEWEWERNMSEEKRKAWNDFFTKKKARFERFLQTAIDMDWPIDASV